MNIRRSIAWACMPATFSLIIGCSVHQQTVAGNELNSLPSEQQSVALERQKQIDKLKIEERRCLKAAEITTRINIPVGTREEKVEVHLSEDLNIYRQCMEQAGWELPITINPIKTDH